MTATKRALLVSAAICASALGGCTYPLVNAQTEPVGYSRVAPQRDTMPVRTTSIAYKPAAAPARAPVFQMVRATAVFDEAVAANQAIGNAAPDFEFRLINQTIRGWESNAGDILYVDGEDEGAVQYLFAPNSDSPMLIGTQSRVFVFDDWALIGAFTASGTPLPEGERLLADIEAQMLLVRGRTIHRASTEQIEDPEPSYARVIQPAVVSVSWSPWLYSTWGGFDPWYDRYRVRRDSRERHERWRAERRRRDRGEPGMHPPRRGRGDRGDHTDHAGRPGNRPPPDVVRGPGPGGGRDRTDDGRRPPRDSEYTRPRAIPSQAERFEPAASPPPRGPMRPAPEMNTPRDRPPPARFDRVPSPAPPVTSAPPQSYTPPPQPVISAPPPVAAAPPPPPPPPARSEAPPSRNDVPRVTGGGDRDTVRPD